MWDYRIRNTLGNIHVVDFKTSHVRTFFSALSDEALTLEQQEKLLKFVEQSNVYKPHLPMMQVMFGACLRVSETIG